MLGARQRRRKGGLEIVVDGAAGEPTAYPGKIVVMRDGGQAGLSDDLGHGQPQRHMHRDGEDVLRDEYFDLEFLEKPVEFVLEPLLDRLDLVGGGAGTRRGSEK